MSFHKTTAQVENETKFVTRRLGWDNLKIGELLQAVEKAQGLKKGEKMRKLKVIRVKFIRKEMLCDIESADCYLEGFPKMTPREFVDMFVAMNGCKRNATVNRIEFEYVDKRKEKS